MLLQKLERGFCFGDLNGREGFFAVVSELYSALDHPNCPLTG